MQSKPLFENIDCVEMYVDDLDDGIAYYCGALGLKLLWKTQNSAGLGMANGITEIMINTQRKGVLVDVKVESVENALPQIVEAGGTIEVPMFDIDIGKCAVVKDKWQNTYVLLDMTKGHYVADENGNILGVEK